MNTAQKIGARRLAIIIARRLFTNGANQRAKRLVLELYDGRDGGGWCEEAAIDQIERVLIELSRNKFAGASSPVPPERAGP